MPCPMCRKGFTIPDDGLSGLQKNFFMEKLFDVRKLSAEQEAQHIPCEGQLNQHFSYDIQTGLLIYVQPVLHIFLYIPAYLGVLHCM